MEKTLLAKGREIQRLAAELAAMAAPKTAQPAAAAKSGEPCCAARARGGCPVTAEKLRGREDSRLQRLTQLAQLHGLQATSPDGEAFPPPSVPVPHCCRSQSIAAHPMPTCMPSALLAWQQ